MNKINKDDLAKWYVKQVLDAIDCEDQTNQNLFGVNTCFYLDMDFEHLEKLTKPVIENYVDNRYSQEYIDQVVYHLEIKNLYKDYINKYKIICLRHVNQSFTNWYEEFARHYLNIVIADICTLEDSRDYPKGLQTNSHYFEDLFEDHIIFHQSIKVEDFSKVADIFDSKMEDLICKINKQRQIDGI